MGVTPQKKRGRAIRYIFCGEPRHKRMPLLSLTRVKNKLVVDFQRKVEKNLLHLPNLRENKTAQL